MCQAACMRASKWQRLIGYRGFWGPAGLARGVPGLELVAPATSGGTEPARPVTGRVSGHPRDHGPRSAVPGGTCLGVSRGAARTAQADVRVPRSQGVPSADRPGVSRGGPVRRPPDAGGSRRSAGHGAVVERAQSDHATPSLPSASASTKNSFEPWATPPVTSLKVFQSAPLPQAHPLQLASSKPISVLLSTYVRQIPSCTDGLIGLTVTLAIPLSV